MSRDSTFKILSVAFLLCVVCSILVSAAAVSLQDRQERNADDGNPDAAAHAAIVTQRVEARHLPRIHEQLQRAGKGNAEQHHKRHGRVEIEQMAGIGPLSQLSMILAISVD